MAQNHIRRIENLENVLANQDIIHVELDQLEKTFSIPNASIKCFYSPPLTGKEFHRDNSLVRLIIGPYGSGKSTACCAEILLRACKMPKCVDGIKRSRWAIVRNSYPELKTTSLKTWMDWFSELGSVSITMDAPIRFTAKFNDAYGPVELEILFISLDKPKDIKKLLSLEVTGIYMNECRELPSVVFEHAIARVARYPSVRMCPSPYWSGIIMDTNPPDQDHWIYKKFEVDMPDGYRVFKQPPAVLEKENGEYEMNPKAENLDNLQGHENYYLNMIIGKTKEYIKVYAQGYYGSVIEGKLVYEQYNDDFHAVDSIAYEPSEPLVIGWDSGLTPAALILQYVGGQLRCLKEFVTDRMFSRELASSIVMPYLTSNYRGNAVTIYVDKSAPDVVETLTELGMDAEACLTNDVEPRLEAVAYFLSRLTEGKPAFILSKEGCPNLRKGFLGKYNKRRLAVVGEERYRDYPDKTHPWSDIQDCLQYGALHFVDLVLNANKKVDSTIFINREKY